MKNKGIRLLVVINLILGLNLLVQAGQVADEMLITENSVGRVKLGMTVGQARTIWKNYRFERTRDGEFSALIAVKNGKELLMVMYADEQGNLTEKSPIQNNAPIEFIEVFSKNFQTSAGVFPKMLLKNAESIYGRVDRLEMSEIESREYARFSNQPKHLSFQVGGSEEFAGTEYQTINEGIDAGLRVSKKYDPRAFIKKIVISKHLSANDKQEPDTEFSSYFTDLKKDCREIGGKEGQHVSHFCKGPGKFQIHYFDSATTLEFLAETKDRRQSVRLSSQSLGYVDENPKIEWLLADGQPFAVMMKTFVYKKDDTGLIKYPTQILEEKFILKGLPGFERIDDQDEGKGADSRLKSMAQDEYEEIKLPFTRVEIPKGSNEILIDGFIGSIGGKLKYKINAQKGYRMTVTIQDVVANSDEGPIMVGIITSPNGETDGSPGGLVFDSVLDETGDYEILVFQNRAKSQVMNFSFRVKITLEPEK